MAQSDKGEKRIVGDYVVEKQIGSGSFSVVWLARHRVHQKEVAIKEVITGRLNKKLQESLMSEIVILKKINHPNIIRLLDIIEETGRIYFVLEYCRGGDLSIFIQRRHGRVSEATAKHFMQQLAAGLQILRDNNLIHRDLKPQNLLLSANDDNATLKIADFGFARPLQPKGLAETLCGSPLYMAPEIMQLQKYDAKADLWSVGAILFQLVTGKPPFTGNNQIQLFDNIMKSTDLHFPPDKKKDLSPESMDLCRKLLRRNPVERLTFEEFFNHPFLSLRHKDDILRSRVAPRRIGTVSLYERNTLNSAEEDRSEEDALPFSLEDESNASPTLRLPSMKSSSLDKKVEFNTLVNMDFTPNYRNSLYKQKSAGLNSWKYPEQKPRASLKSTDQRPQPASCQIVPDSFDFVDQEYVLVPDIPLDVSSSPTSASKPCKLGSLQQPQPSMRMNSGSIERSFNSHDSAPSTDCTARMKSLQHFASAITELVTEKVEKGRHLEAFSLQLVILAIWKQALNICHTEAAASTVDKRHKQKDNHPGVCSRIEGTFLLELGNAENLAKMVENGNEEMPDAMETIYQSALAFGRHGAVDECMGDMQNAAILYSKATCLLAFLLVDAQSLILNPPFSLTSTERYRLQNYMDIINNRESYSKSQFTTLLNCDDQLRSS
ncbi:serine/threonine-protein kinase ATG1c-like [Impatiens glandulifera]|uniref:serine/threonine-protein kinase ATG1c-like n=1 Tax=Impatiens glandulifera TaxID=253017 RepID=UPI001FB0D895|nr:serine/threonine-protein kinase ATG1c-like [Impatiens glandulifera]